ncbi:MAG: efflux RND transporter periplasmic adaptor subunit, partial [Bacillota bacterium]|nr:efflux RND transporter periplasmic adaptor subunit [Bacillota bacterium]
QPINQYNLSSSSGGKVTEIDVKVGDTVKAGQQLAKLDPSQAQGQLDQAQANLIQAQAKVDQAGSNSTNLEAAQLQLSAAQIAVNTAENALEDTTIKAPAAGIITAINGQVNSTSSSGQTSTSAQGSQGNNALITMIGASDTMQVVVPVNQVDIGKVSVGQSSNITLDAFPGENFSGTVTQVSPIGTSQSGVTTFNVTINVTNKGNMMKTGMSANVTIIIAQKKDVLVVPSAAVHTKGSTQTVSLAPVGSAAPVVQTIQIGLDDGKNAEVIQGLKEGDKVVTGIRSSQAKGTTSSNTLNKTLNGGNMGLGGGNGGFGGGYGGNGGMRGNYSGGNGDSGGRTQN